MPTDPNREETLFAAALKLSPAERSPFLERECAGDAPLRQRMDGLPQADVPADQFLEQPAVALGALSSGGSGDASANAGTSNETRLAPVTEQAGDLIERYKLLEKIGEGGFGDVWMAEQAEPVRRRVALRIINRRTEFANCRYLSKWNEPEGRVGLPKSTGAPSRSRAATAPLLIVEKRFWFERIPSAGT